MPLTIAAHPASRGVAMPRDIGLALLAGGLSSLGFAPLNLWPLTLLALALLLHRAAGASSLRARMTKAAAGAPPAHHVNVATLSISTCWLRPHESPHFVGLGKA